MQRCPGLEYWWQDMGCTRDRESQSRPELLKYQIPILFFVMQHTFIFSRKSCIFTHLFQGYCESPSSTIRLWDAAWSLCNLHPAWLFQLFSSIQMSWWFVTRDKWEKDTVKLLKHLAAEGHKASLFKWQFVQRQVIFLWHVIKFLSSKRVEAIQKLPRTISKKQCHSWVCAHTSEISFPIRRPLRLHWVHSFM